MLVDSHCHLDCINLDDHQHNFENLLTQAQQHDVGYFLCVSIELKDYPALVRIAEQYSNISISVGEHPNNDPEQQIEVQVLLDLAKHPKCVAIGETGLDYFRTQGDNTWQQTRFRNHIQAALISKKPLIIHTREAAADTIAIMTEENAKEIGGVMHCFTESWDIAKQALDLGFYISFSGIITFKNAIQVQDVAKKTPLDRILIETDSPYLAPVPFRGKPNQPAYVKYVAEAVAELKNISYAEVANHTTENFFRLFKNARR